MSLITWSDKYSVGIKTIDDQHKKLVDLINGLNDVMKEGKGKEVVDVVINDLVDYTKFHFATEEGFMRRTGYPESAEHIKENSDFTAKVLEYKKEFEEKKSLSLIIGISGFLWDWLSKHILVIDKKYSAFFIEKGI